MITSGGNRNPANADLGGIIGRGRAASFITQACLDLAHGQRNRPSMAATLLGKVLLNWPASMRQDEVLWRGWLAQAHAAAGQLPSAGTEAMRALTLARGIGSARAQRVFERLATEVDVPSPPAEVREFLATYRAGQGQPKAGL